MFSSWQRKRCRNCDQIGAEAPPWGAYETESRVSNHRELLGALPFAGPTLLRGVADDLAVGASATGTASYDILQSDIDAGSFTNVADGAATDPNGDPVTGTDDETVTFTQDPVLTVTKTAGARTDADGDLRDSAGDDQAYNYTVSNTGNVTLYDVSLVDDNGTPGDTSDDVTISLVGLTDEDGDGVAEIGRASCRERV